MGSTDIMHCPLAQPFTLVLDKQTPSAHKDASLVKHERCNSARPCQQIDQLEQTSTLQAHPFSCTVACIAVLQAQDSEDSSDLERSDSFESASSGEDRCALVQSSGLRSTSHKARDRVGGRRAVAGVVGVKGARLPQQL